MIRVTIPIMVKVLNSSQFRNNLAVVLEQVEKKRRPITIARFGRPQAVLLDIATFELIQRRKEDLKKDIQETLRRTGLALKKAGITLKELQSSGRRVRREIFAERYGKIY